MSISASNTPHVESEALVVAVHTAIVEDHAPRVAGDAGAGRRRPVGAPDRTLVKGWPAGKAGSVCDVSTRLANSSIAGSRQPLRPPTCLW